MSFIATSVELAKKTRKKTLLEWEWNSFSTERKPSQVPWIECLCSFSVRRKATESKKKIMPERSRMCVLYLHLCWHILYPCASGLNGLSIFNLWPQMFITCPRWYLESWLFISSLTSLMLTCLPRCLGSRRSNLCRAMENQPFTAKSSTNEKLSTAVVDYQRVCFTQPE